MPGPRPPKKHKANLANALASHTQRKAEKAHQVKVEEAEKRKKQSLAAGSGQKKRRRKLDDDGNAAGGSGSREAIQRLLADDQPESSSTAAAASSTSSPAQRRWPFHPLDTILLIGEGDFSFTLSLVTSPSHKHSPTRIVATTLEPSLSHLTTKYPHTAPAHISRLTSLGVTIRYGVDAARPLADAVLRKWCDPRGETKGFTKVWWGFPHAGGGEKDEARNVAMNQLMLCRGFVGLRGVVRVGGRRPGYARKGMKGKKGKRKGGGEEEVGESEGEDEEEEYPVVTDEEKDAADDDDNGEANRSTTSLATYPPHPLPPTTLPSSLLITLRPIKPYTLWRLPTLGSSKLTDVYPLILHNAPALPKGAPRNPTVVEIQDAERKGGVGSWEVWTSRPFWPGEWEGYRHVTTGGGREKRRGGGMEGSGLLGGGDEEEASSVECRTWEFGLSGTPQ